MNNQFYKVALAAALIASSVIGPYQVSAETIDESIICEGIPSSDEEIMLLSDSERVFLADENNLNLPEVQFNEEDPENFKYMGDGMLEECMLNGSTDGYNHDSRFDGVNVSKGIDVSSHQDSIDWNSVRDAGYEFAIIRVGFRGYGESGTLNFDQRYYAHMDGAKAAGLKVGIYIYSQAINCDEARAEAEFALNNKGGYGLDLPIVMDYEYAGGGRLQNAGLSNDQRTEICRAFCDKIREAGYDPMIYANYSMLCNDLNAGNLENDYKIWLARFNTEAGYGGKYDYWQYTSHGSVPGVNGNCDCDFCYNGQGGAGQKPSNNPTPTPSYVPKQMVFLDVDQSKWYFPAVKFVFEKEFMSGTSQLFFEPDKVCTRAEFVQILYNMIGKPDCSWYSIPFTDVVSLSWYENAVRWAYLRGITAGTSPTTFGVSDTVTREQVASFLCKFAAVNGKDYMKREDVSYYSDANQISNWALESVQWAKAHHIMNGKDTFTLDPKGTASRAEIAQMIMAYRNEFGY